MSVSSPLPADHPLMIAWEAHKQTEEFANSVLWAQACTFTVEQQPGSMSARTRLLLVTADHAHLNGSLWALFEAGWRARSQVADGPPRREPQAEEAG